MVQYATIKRGKVKLKVGGKQFRYLMAHKLPFSIVTISRKGKSIKRMNT